MANNSNKQKEWTLAEVKEIKRLLKIATSWEELKKVCSESKILKYRDWRTSIQQKIYRNPKEFWTKHFSDIREQGLKKEDIRDKQFLFDDSKKIIPQEAFSISSDSWKKNDEYVGLISRLDYGSKGFRIGAIRLAFEEAARNSFRFNVLIGGLVDKEELKAELSAELKELGARLKGLRLSSEEKKIQKEGAINAFYLKHAQELARLIPAIKRPDGKNVKLYVFISPAYDGKIGDEIVKRLTALRKDDDIIYWSSRYENSLLVKHIDKKLMPLAPRKGVWMRSDYYSTPVDRVLKDFLKLSAALPDIFAIGCFASSILRPKGESRRAYVSVPALHKLSNTKTSENQVGMRVVRFLPNDEFSAINYSFKDLIREERNLITVPSSCNDLQRAIIEMLRKEPMSSGIVQYFLEEQSAYKNVRREDIISAIEGLKRFKVGIDFNPESGLYDFNPEWFKRKAVYKSPFSGNLTEDCFVGVACIHAGAPQTNYGFIINDIPRYILQYNAKYLIGAGDFVQGTNHFLLEKGQIYRGLNDTYQEMLVAGLMGVVISKVFEARFKEAIRNKKDFAQDELRQIIENSLLTFLYLEGNHDAWKRSKSFVPLVIFKKYLIDFIVVEVKRVIKEQKLNYAGVFKLIEKKIIQDSPMDKIFYKTPSGLSIKVGHPFTARNITASISSERYIAKYLDSQLNFIGNWHVALGLEHYDQEIGQRVVIQLPTIQKYTDFEDSKMKKTDFGICVCRVGSQNGRIIKSEIGFYGERGDLEKIDNEIIDEILKKVGVPLR